MATVHAAPGLAGTRSIRGAASTSRPFHVPGPAPALFSNAASAIGPSAMVALGSAGTHAANFASTTPNVSVLLTNLRLLDLDLLPDWPNIEAATFSTKDGAAQGQKRRIQCVEWILYNLFLIWDPDETRSKLEPLFPPADQVQSLSLRAGLLRSLEQAKKKGVLGRDAILRKTMLDECRGERLEDVLVAFSSAVLKKSVAAGLGSSDGDSSHPPVSQQLALQNLGYSSLDGRTQQQIVVLIIAHKASLSNLVRRKNAARARLRDFGELLDIKSRSISRRTEQLREATATESGLDGYESFGDEGDARQEIWRTVRSNWSGNEHWMEALLHGDANVRRDGVLSAPFDRVWRRVHAGRLAELEQTPKHGAGLLDELQRRVHVQQTRLRKWEEFHSRAFGSEPTSGSKSPAKKLGMPKTNAATGGRRQGVDLGFNVHGALRLGYLSPRKRPVGTVGHDKAVSQEYVDLVADLDAELARIGASKMPSLAGLVRAVAPRKTVASSVPVAEPTILLTVDTLTDEPISELSELEDQIEKLTMDKRPGSEPKPESRPERPSPTRQWSSRSTRREGRSRSGSPQKKAVLRVTEMEAMPQSTDIPPPMLPPTKATRSPTRPRVSRNNSQREAAVRDARSQDMEEDHDPASLPIPRPGSPPEQDDLAKQILASVAAASPTPAKKPRHTLSLAERTRLTMSRTSRAKGLEDDTDEEPGDAVILTRGNSSKDRSQISPAAVQEVEDKPDDQPDDLVARTRKSMVNFEAARKKAQLERRKSLRKSKHLPTVPNREGGGPFAKVWEEDEEAEDASVAAAGAPTENLDDTTMLMDGAGGDEDYEAVFRSRPKIKNSPVPTPNRD